MPLVDIVLIVLGIIIAIVILLLVIVTVHDRFFEKKNLVIGNFPLLGRGRYVMHELRPFFRQYFGDDDAFAPRIIIDWILDLTKGKSGYFAFDKFDTTGHLHDGTHQMIHSSSPLNMDEIKSEYPLIGKKRKHPFQMKSFFYRSAMSLGSLSFEATSAMAAACADAGAAFNTGEGGLSVHHIPRVSFSEDKKFFKFKRMPLWGKILYKLPLGIGWKTNITDWVGYAMFGKEQRDLYLFCLAKWVYYKIDWDAPIEHFPKPEELTEDFGNIILQIGSGLYGLREKRKDGTVKLDWDRFKKVTSFVRAIEIKLAQGAKQTGGILKAHKNTHAIAEIRGIHEGIDLISPNRFPYYNKDGESDFFDFIEKLSEQSGGKPVGAKIVISANNNIEPLVKELASRPVSQGLDFITVDGGDGGSGAAPIALGVLFGKKIFEALEIVNDTLATHKVRDRVNVFASSKLYAPHMSARALAKGADAIGNARSIMIAGGCIRAGRCSGEHGACPVGMATMNKYNRKSYARSWDKKVNQITNYLHGHEHGLEQVAAVCGVKSPSQLGAEHVMN